MGGEPQRKTNKRRQGASRQISLSEQNMIKTVSEDSNARYLESEIGRLNDSATIRSIVLGNGLRGCEAASRDGVVPWLFFLQKKSGKTDAHI